MSRLSRAHSKPLAWHAKVTAGMWRPPPARGGGGAVELFVCLWILFFFFFVVFLGLHPQHMEVPWLGVKSELQLPAYTIATAIPDLSHSLWQHLTLNPLSEASWILVRFVTAEP